jgi:hypothetical protein
MLSSARFKAALLCNVGIPDLQMFGSLPHACRPESWSGVIAPAQQTILTDCSKYLGKEGMKSTLVIVAP